MKKIITLSVSLVLIVVALFISYIPMDYAAGRGKGKNEEIKTVERLSTLLTDSCRLMSNESEPSTTEKTFESVTVDMQFRDEYDITIENDTIHYRCKGNVKVYIDAEGRMLFSIRDAEVTINSDSTSSSTHMYCSYDADMYLHNGVCAVKYYSVLLNGNTEKSILGKWIDLKSVSGELATLLTSNANATKSWMMLVDKYITEYRNDAFYRNGQVFVMNEEYLVKYLLDSFAKSSEQSVDSSFHYFDHKAMSMQVDLSNAESPTVTTDAEDVAYKASVRTSADSEPVQAICQYTSYQKLCIENINNTVIDFDESKIVDFKTLLE